MAPPKRSRVSTPPPQLDRSHLARHARPTFSSNAKAAKPSGRKTAPARNVVVNVTVNTKTENSETANSRSNSSVGFSNSGGSTSRSVTVGAPRSRSRGAVASSSRNTNASTSTRSIASTSASELSSIPLNAAFVSPNDTQVGVRTAHRGLANIHSNMNVLRNTTVIRRQVSKRRMPTSLEASNSSDLSNTSSISSSSSSSTSSSSTSSAMSTSDSSISSVQIDSPSSSFLVLPRQNYLASADMRSVIDGLSADEIMEAVRAEEALERQRRQIQEDEQLARRLGAGGVLYQDALSMIRLPPPQSSAVTTNAELAQFSLDDTKDYDTSCLICFDRPNNPVQCRFCKQCVGCRMCVKRWYDAADSKHTCPLCRHVWHSFGATSVQPC
ncbi:unnamed protein product [Bursaphelenchus okinawaensis]|uniref:RING-type domain-containing protein n=1 Tax=Bursaphelenchus okinawaensis TaxID=465554 RepID=A0A811LPI7_9BILA|nr:unnamed protein product [Bursaphelenchus okinawaensis]CAG9127001.1 unnamed protein product [Bursaphelenchus okinawaensis]